MNRAVQIIVGIVVLALVAGGSFYGGMLYGTAQAQAALPAGPGWAGGTLPDTQPGGTPGARARQGAGAGFGAQAGMTVGQIDMIDGDTLVITNMNGNQIRVQVTDTTLIEKNASVTVADLAAGETVMVSGSENDDGSITARSVQVSPAGRFGGRPAAGSTEGQ